MEIVTAAHSDTGKVRTRNEDSFICMSGQTNLVNVDAVLVSPTAWVVMPPAT